MAETKPYLQVGVKILIRNEEDKYLLLKRSEEKYPEVENPWDIPGGRINPNTPLVENLAREIREETGLELKGEPKVIAAQDIMDINRFPGRHVVRLTYVGEATGEITIDTEENSECGWFSLDELKNLSGLDKYLKEILEKDLIS